MIRYIIKGSSWHSNNFNCNTSIRFYGESNSRLGSFSFRLIKKFKHGRFYYHLRW